VTATIISPWIIPDHPGNLPGWSCALPGASETAAYYEVIKISMHILPVFYHNHFSIIPRNSLLLTFISNNVNKNGHKKQNTGILVQNM
jgi:hypothetical protein